MTPATSMFDLTGPHYCPNACSQPHPSIPRITVRIHLEPIPWKAADEHKANQDLARCPRCGRAYVIRYIARRPIRYKSRDCVPNLNAEYVQ